MEETQRQEQLEKERLALQHELKTKDKLLSGNSEPIYVLLYFSDFRTKLFRACELDRGNLTSSQKSMKKEYDIDAVVSSQVKRSLHCCQCLVTRLTPGFSDLMPFRRS